MFIDTHAHLYSESFDKDRTLMVKEAISQGVSKMFLPDIDKDSTAKMLELSDQFPGVCYPMLGLHPCSVKENYKDELARIEQLLTELKVYGIGETGIDHYWDRSFDDIQEISFRKHIEWAKLYKLPIIIHSRDSLDLTISIIEELQGPELRGVFHCFNGTVEQGKRIASTGFFMGLGGVSTFKNAGMDQVIPLLDESKIVLETDAPYLAPVPYRGKRNEPKYIPHIAEKIADYKNISVQDVADLTTTNALNLFNLAEK